MIVGWGHPAPILAASTEGLVSTDAGELAGRYRARGIQSDLFDPAWFHGATDWLHPDKIEARVAELNAVQDAPISSDLHPVSFMPYALVGAVTVSAAKDG